ncbi:MAG TPA: slipin family protein [Tepidisphaeraceae bacterium]|jgi:regulator of protease activity HflC (stomatin/prohibitin superfamily)
MFRLVHVREHERGLWFRRGDFQDLIMPGSTWLLSWQDKIVIVDTLATRFEHPLLDVLITKPQLLAQLQVVNLDSMQRALVWKDGRLLAILGPGLHAFWKTSAKLEIETFDITSSIRLDHRRLQAILQSPEASKFLQGVVVTDHEDVLLYRDGVLVETLGQGMHVFWKGNGHVTWKAVDRREQTIDVAGQEIITSDKVTLRVNLFVMFQVADAVRAVQSTPDHTQALYREAQLVLRAAVGTKTLDALLGDKESVGAEVRDALTKRAAELGISVKSVGLRDIILPGNMKTLLNQVIAATKEAEANLIRRREETAAARSQANTAKLLAENPLLVRLKELEMLKEVLSDTNTTFVLGQGDLSDQLRALVSTKSQSS